MPPLLHHPPLIKHINNIRMLNRTQAVRNRNRRAALRRQVERGLHDALRGRVERAGDGYALALAAGEERAFCADEGGEARGEGGYEVVDVCCEILVCDEIKIFVWGLVLPSLQACTMASSDTSSLSARTFSRIVPV
jgi:hypothetical protein